MKISILPNIWNLHNIFCKYISSYLFLRGRFVIKMNRRVSYARWYREIFHSIKRSQWISQQTSCIFNISKNYLLGLEKGENNSALVWVELSWGWAWQYALYSTINTTAKTHLGVTSAFVWVEIEIEIDT